MESVCLQPSCLSFVLFCMLIKIQGQIVECVADICSLSEPALNLALNVLTKIIMFTSTDTAKIMAISLHSTPVEILETIQKYLWENPSQLVSTDHQYLVIPYDMINRCQLYILCKKENFAHLNYVYLSKIFIPTSLTHESVSC